MTYPPSLARRRPTGNLVRRIAGNTGIGLIGSGVLMAGTIVRTVILARELEIDTFGLVVICTNAVLFVRMILRIGVGETLLRFVPEFLQKDNKEAIGSLLWLMVYLTVAIAAIVLALAYAGSEWAARVWYHHPEIAQPMRLVAWMAAFFTIVEATGALLRFLNQFHLTLISSVAGALASLGAVWIFEVRGVLDLEHAVLAVALADGVTILSASVLWALSARRWMSFRLEQVLLRPLKGFARPIRETLTQTSILGILQSGSEVGGTFLLGILGTPAQVAIMGMAIQLSRPLKVIQGNLGNAVTPEVHKLHAQQRFSELLAFLKRYATVGLAIILGLTLLTWPLAHWLVPIVLKPEYLEAIPVFFVLVLSAALMIPFQPFLPIAVARGEVGRRNLVTLLRPLYLLGAALTGITAMGVAMSQLFGCLAVRLLNDWPLYRRLKRQAEMAA